MVEYSDIVSNKKLIMTNGLTTFHEDEGKILYYPIIRFDFEKNNYKYRLYNCIFDDDLDDVNTLFNFINSFSEIVIKPNSVGSSSIQNIDYPLTDVCYDVTKNVLYFEYDYINIDYIKHNINNTSTLLIDELNTKIPNLEWAIIKQSTEVFVEELNKFFSFTCFENNNKIFLHELNIFFPFLNISFNNTRNYIAENW